MILSSENNTVALTTFFNKHNILLENEVVKAIEIPGEGNMNVVLRIITNTRTFIAKQSRPFVQKYQDIPAPIDRISVEHQFYKNIDKGSINRSFPKPLHFIPEHHMLIIEDLGYGDDMTSIYATRNISDKTTETLTQIASGIHSTSISKAFPENLELRKLNHQHIFVLPFLADNGFSLNSVQNGLLELAQPIKDHSSLKENITNLGNLYLKTGGVLLHGDYYPGSWLQQNKNVFVLDPEFSFMGPAEFDLGVMIAHLVMATGKKTMFNKVIDNYNLPINTTLVKAFAGSEIIRRIIGLAQLPLQRTIKEKQQLLNLATTWVLN
ncbi:phosphotransferase [Seonamhaeicola algicola]|uniref:Phosphotransferase n=1 Tax=Seonamhaeicola algicola TaxID=1719036 RepID=A0A5C7B106_9FLAO|nr:phosphotransferase [Seonamhaeicola algicola]TXE11582.1 phosphotransferase [Seonamhaeicola algicola]